MGEQRAPRCVEHGSIHPSIPTICNAYIHYFLISGRSRVNRPCSLRASSHGRYSRPLPRGVMGIPARRDPCCVSGRGQHAVRGFHSSRPSAKRDFYDILGVSKGAEKSEVGDWWWARVFKRICCCSSGGCTQDATNSCFSCVPFLPCFQDSRRHFL